MFKALAARLESSTLTGTLAGRPITFPIGQTIDAAGEFVVLDIADAQQALSIATASSTASTSPSAPSEDFAAVEKAIRSVLPVFGTGRKARRAQRREPAHAARLAGICASSATSPGGRRISHLQHDFGERGAAPRGDRHPARPRRRALHHPPCYSWPRRCSSASLAPRWACCSDAFWRVARCV